MASVSGLLVTVRTAKQGAEMMKGKLTPGYLQEISKLRVNPEDMADIAVSEGQSVRITSPYGEAVAVCHPEDLPRGIFILPLGQLANRLFSGANTGGTGVPDWKRQPVTLEPYTE